MNTDVHEPETTTGSAEDGDGRRGSRWRAAAWATAPLLLLVPLVVMQFTDDVVNWTAGDFVFAGALLFGSLGAYEVVVRRTRDAVHRAGVVLAIAATVLLLWGHGALYITDSAADGKYYWAAALGIIGVVAALFRPGVGAGAMIAAALTMVLVTVSALVAGMVPNSYASTVEVVGITGFYVALFAGAAWLLWAASRRAYERGTV